MNNSLKLFLILICAFSSVSAQFSVQDLEDGLVREFDLFSGLKIVAPSYFNEVERTEESVLISDGFVGFYISLVSSDAMTIAETKDEYAQNMHDAFMDKIGAQGLVFTTEQYCWSSRTSADHSQNECAQAFLLTGQRDANSSFVAQFLVVDLGEQFLIINVIGVEDSERKSALYFTRRSLLSLTDESNRKLHGGARKSEEGIRGGQSIKIKVAFF